jgi:dTDP-4-amino-4,6-dideoxygalactose transaminase
MLCTDDDKIAERARLLRFFGLRSHGEGVVELGFKYPLTDFQAALGLAQLRKAGYKHALREAVALRYFGAFKGTPIRPLRVKSSTTRHAWTYFAVRIPRRDKVRSFLASRGVETAVHYKPLHTHPFWVGKYGKQRLPKAEKAYQEILSLPMYAGLKRKEQDYVISCLMEALARGESL